MAVVTGNDYDHIDIQNGSNTTRHMLKDSTARTKIDDLVEVSSTQPVSADNQIWVSPSGTEYQVPTYDEFSDLKSAFVDQQEGKLPYFIVKNEYINASNGAFQSYNGWDRTELIPVSEYSSIKVKSSVNSGYNAFYKADKTFWSQVAVSTTETEVPVPVQVAYVAFSNSTTGMANLEVSYIRKIDNTVDDIYKGMADASTGLIPLVLTRNENVNANDGSFVIGMGYTRTGHVYVGNAQQIIINAGASSAYNCYYDADKNRIDSFSVSAGENIINLANNVQYIALSMETDSMLQTTVRISKYRTPDYEYENGYNAYVYNDIPETVYSYDNGLTYSVENGVITLDGALTSTTFRQDFPLVTLNGYYIFNIEVLSGSYTGNLYILKLPHSSGQNAYIIGENGALSGHVNRLDYFDDEEHGFAVYASNGATFDNLKFRIWLVPGLLDKPFDLPGYTIQHSLATGCDVGEYNAPDYTHIGDGVTYSAFGNAFAVCKDGMIGKNVATDAVKFGLITDLHYTDHENFYKRIYTKLSDENIDFCLMTGDIIDSGYFSTVALHHAQMMQYKNSIQYLRCPNFPFAGNHDDDVAEFAHHGVVDYGNVRFIYFWADYDGTSEAGLVKAEELTWLGTQLAQSKAKYNILMCHYAVSTDTGFGWYIADSSTRDAIKTLASTYGVKLYLNGHEHDHNITVGTAGVMTDINLPDGKYAYAVCTIDGTGAFEAKFYDATTDTLLKTVNVML